MGDSVGESTARMNISDLRKLLGITDTCEVKSSSPNGSKTVMYNDTRTIVNAATNSARSNISSNKSTSSRRQFRVRRQSMEQLDLIKV